MAFRAKPAEERLPESPEHLFRELGGAAGGHYRAGTGGEHVRIGLPTGKTLRTHDRHRIVSADDNVTCRDTFTAP
jgi:hypothetical protein